MTRWHRYRSSLWLQEWSSEHWQSRLWLDRSIRPEASIEFRRLIGNLKIILQYSGISLIELSPVPVRYTWSWLQDRRSKYQWPSRIHHTGNASAGIFKTNSSLVLALLLKCTIPIKTRAILQLELFNRNRKNLPGLLFSKQEPYKVLDILWTRSCDQVHRVWDKILSIGRSIY